MAPNLFGETYKWEDWIRARLSRPQTKEQGPRETGRAGAAGLPEQSQHSADGQETQVRPTVLQSCQVRLHNIHPCHSLITTTLFKLYANDW